MVSTPFTLATTLAMSIIVTALLSLYLRSVRYEILFSPNALIAVLCVPLIRLLLPVEFPFTKVIRSYKYYPELVDVMTEERIKLFDIGINIIHLCLIVWAAGFLYILIRQVLKYRSISTQLQIMPASDDKRFKSIINKYFDSRNKKRIPIRVVQINANISPFIFGIKKTTIVLPKIDLSAWEWEAVIGHELNHYCYGDLVTKGAIGIISAFYWWLPYIRFLNGQINSVMEIRADKGLFDEKSKSQRNAYIRLLAKMYENSEGKHDNKNQGTNCPIRAN